MNFDGPEQERTFSTQEITELLNISHAFVMSVSRRLGLEIKKKNDETHACVWSYLDFKRIEKAVKQNKKINAMRRPKNVLYSNAQEHPLVTDKRCLNLYYWPDVIPDCFKDMEE